VISVIEQEMNGSPGLIYMESVSQANGTGSITLSFEPAPTRPRAGRRAEPLSRAAPRLPAAVTQQGVRVDKARSNFLLFTILSSDNPASTRWRWATTPRATCCPKSSACPASARRSCSAPSARCASGSTRPSWSASTCRPADVNAAIRAQNAQVSSGTIGDLPNVPARPSAPPWSSGQLTVVEQFGNIVLRANTDGSTVRLRDVARIELGGAELRPPRRA
jgi:multidrug efflux pump